MKLLNVSAAIIAIATIVIDVLFMFVLFSLGDAMQGLGQVSAEADLADVQAVFGMVISAGWVWSILVLICGLFVLKAYVLDARKKKETSSKK